MDEATKKILMQSIKELKSKSGKDVKPVIDRLERLIRKKRIKKGIKKA